MSDEETTGSSNSQMLTAEYKDGSLQIVEMTPFERDKNNSILPDDGEEHKYMQVLDNSKGLVQLDLLNLTLVRCADNEESYRLVSNPKAGSSDMTDDNTVTCVLQSSDGEEPDHQESYMIMEADDGPLMLVQSSSQAPDTQGCPDTPETTKKEDKSKLSPTQLLEKAKTLKRLKALASSHAVRAGRRGRRGKAELPPPHELLASPHFKLYLYACKLCHFQCNAVKELQAHRAASHAMGGAGGRPRAAPRGPPAALQCARCPFRGCSEAQLARHNIAKHSEEVEEVVTHKVSLDSKEVEEADVLVCGACGYESGDRSAFRKHIEDEHGATIE